MISETVQNVLANKTLGFSGTGDAEGLLHSKREGREVGSVMGRNEFKGVFLPGYLYSGFRIQRQRFLGSSLLLACQGCSYHRHLAMCTRT